MNRILIFVSVLLMYFSSSSFAAVVAYWQFEGDYSDSSGNSYTMTPVGSHSFESDVSSSALGTFSITNSDATYLQSNYMLPGTGYTVEFFFKSSSSDPQTLFGTFDCTASDGDAANAGWDIILEEAGTISIHSQLVSSSGGYNDGEWHHVAVTCTTDYILTGYIDGVSFGQITTPSYFYKSERNYVKLGSRHLEGLGPYTPQYTTGNFDELRISTGVLDSAEFLYTAVPIPEPLSILLLSTAILGFARRKNS